MLNNEILEAWSAAGKQIDNYTSQLGKHEIEEMSEVTYESTIIDLIQEAWDEWSNMRLRHLTEEEQIEIIERACNASAYGSYKGELPNRDVIRRHLALRSFKHMP
jgi:hypothetical protein